ncbi:hypothetical protein KKF84_04445 [Myxococcota bacterium]|nr:hypothetical protein [Myxococcota bacterium]MBU1534545.1 hypothetical protein [Myxococcota bacterium]
MTSTADRLFDPAFKTDPIIVEHASVAIDAVYNGLSLELDLTSDTISILDYYVTTVGKVDRSILFLLSSATGAYFGELMRRILGGVWVIPSEIDPFLWELRFSSCPMSIFPVAIAAEVLAREVVDEIDSSFCVAPSRVALMEEMLDKAIKVTEEEYFSFAGRVDAIEMGVDFLSRVEIALAEKVGVKPVVFGDEDPMLVACIPLSVMDAPAKPARKPRKKRSETE